MKKTDDSREQIAIRHRDFVTEPASAILGRIREVPWLRPGHRPAGPERKDIPFEMALVAGYFLNNRKEGAHMTNEEKEKLIRPWIDPEERITVHFLDASDLNAEVTGCTKRLVDLSIETHVTHMKQHISIPLSQVEVSEDFSHYTRDPERPLQPSRLMLVINEKRPPIIY